MKAVLFCLVAFLIAVSFANDVSFWSNSTITAFPKEGNKYPFMADFKFIPTASDYYLEITVTFSDYYEDFSIDFEGPKNAHVTFVEKEKGITKTIVLQQNSQSLNGWMIDGLNCGALRGVLQSSSPLASIKVSLGLYSNYRSVSSQTFKDCKIAVDQPKWHDSHPRRAHNPLLAVMIALAFFVTALLCCCCVCRVVCSRRCKTGCKQLKEAYPSEAVIESAGPEAYAPVATEDGQQFVVMVPVATESGQAHPSYVQLMPVMYPTQQ